MRESMAQLTPRFSADRTVREYTDQRYLYASKTYLERAANKGEKGKKIINLLHSLSEKWHLIHFGEMKVETIENQYKFDVLIYFNNFDPATIQVELFANGSNGDAPVIQKMAKGLKSEGNVNAYHYSASVSANRPATDYTPRAIPNLSGVSVPLETNLIIWQH
jgi:starch phosphorylase